MAYLDEKGLAYFKGKLDQITDRLNNQITEADTALDNLASLIERDTASGSIVEVNAEYAAPVEKLVVNIEPQQDLHGYDNPWPAGGGKNKFNNTGTTTTSNGVTFTVNADGTISCSGTANGTAVYRVNLTYSDLPQGESLILNGCQANGAWTEKYGQALCNSLGAPLGSTTDAGTGATYTPELLENLGQFQVVIRSGINTNGFVFKPMIRLASVADATFAPYSNICPITGWTGAEVKRMGSNIWNEEWEVGDIAFASGQNTPSNNFFRSKGYISIVGNAQYYLKSPRLNVYFYDKNKVYLGRYTGGLITSIANSVFTVPDKARFMRLASATSGENTYNHDISINYPSTDTVYHAFAGAESLSITFPSDAGDNGTVYGGMLTINPDRTGALVVDKTMVDLGTLTWTDIGTYYASGQALAGVKAPDSGGTKANAISEKYVIATSNGVSGGTEKGIGIRPNGMLYATNFGSTPTGMIIYDLATPVTYQLTESEVSGILSTIRGTNYIWASTGDIAELKYKSGGFATTEVAVKMIEKSAGTKADVITETASGSIVSFSDGADNLPVKSLTVSIEPQQDLHGYENPWPAGGGKNIYPILVGADSWINNNASHSNNNGALVFTVPENTSTPGVYVKGSNSELLPLINNQDHSITVSFDAYATAENYFHIGSEVSPQVVQIKTSKERFSVTIPANHTSSFIIYQRNVNQIANTVYVSNLQVEAGSTATAYEPYSNICPITGWTGAKVTRTGENIFGGITLANTIKEKVPSATIDETAKTINFAGSAVGSKTIVSGIFKENTRYTFMLKGRNSVSSSTAVNLFLKYTDGTNSAYFQFPTAGADSTLVFTSAAGKTVQNIRGIFQANNTILLYEECGIFEGVLTADDFSSFQSKEISVTFPTSAGDSGTVYGGTLTINPDRTGTLVVDRAMKDLGTLNWTYASNAFVSNQFSPAPAANGLLVCSQYKWNSTTNITPQNLNSGEVTASPYFNRRTVFIKDTSFSDAASFKSAMSGVQLVYELEEPQTIPLTATEISGILTTIYGTNNIWSDAGDITVEYPVDTKLYIQQLTKPTEDDMTADHAISAGTFFQLGNTLYLATSQIAAGGTITPGTNATKLSLADALNQLNS